MHIIVTTLVGMVVAVVVIWIALLVCFAILRPPEATLREAVRIVPDALRLVGYADDAIVVGIVLRSVIHRAGPAIAHRHWPGSNQGLALLAQLCRIPELPLDQRV